MTMDFLTGPVNPNKQTNTITHLNVFYLLRQYQHTKLNMAIIHIDAISKQFLQADTQN